MKLSHIADGSLEREREERKRVERTKGGREGKKKEVKELGGEEEIGGDWREGKEGKKT